eukprot:343140_1
MGATCCNNADYPTTDMHVDTETHMNAKKRNRIQKTTDDNYSDTDDETQNKPIKGKKGIFKRNKKPKIIPKEKDESFIESSPDTINTNNINEYNYNNTNTNISDNIFDNNSDNDSENINEISIDTDPEYEIDDSIDNTYNKNKQLTHNEELLILAFRMYIGMDIKDRKWKLKTYKQCFVGNKCVDWLIENHITLTRNEAVQIGQQLVRTEFISHVDRKHDFIDGKYYYRFINPIQKFKNVVIKYGSVIQHRKTFSTVIVERLQFVNELKTKCKKGFDIKDRKYRFKMYSQCFIGEDAVTWMIKNKIAQSRNEAVEMGQLLMNNNIIQHVTQSHQFRDDKKFYEFV